MEKISAKTAAVLLLFMALVSPRISLAAEKVPVGGYVFFEALPVCALILINGQSQFSCDGTGRYDMQVPLDDSGAITIQVFAAGFAPLKEVVSPEQAFEYSVNMSRESFGREVAVSWSLAPSIASNRFSLAGSTESGDAPLCALVLANGQQQFSCGERLGVFELDVPLDQDGSITLQVFVAGFQPFSKTFLADPDTDGDSIKDSIDTDDDNDGILDVDDDCPLIALPEECTQAKNIAATVFADGREWAQVGLFSNLSWSEVNAACRNYTCSGTLNGYDVTGWHWALTTDVERLFNHYLGAPLFSMANRSYVNQDVVVLFDSPEAGIDGWEWTMSNTSADGEPLTFELWGLVKDQYIYPDIEYSGSEPYSPHYVYEPSGACEDDCGRELFQFSTVNSIFHRDQGIGVWLYR